MGFPKELLANLGTLLVPIQIIASILISKYCTQEKEFRVRIFAYIVWIATGFVSLIMILLFDAKND